MPARKGKGRNKWDDRQRIVLHVLAKRDDLPWDEKARIFSLMFDNHLALCGLEQGLPTKALRAQYGDKRPEIWQRLDQPPSPEMARDLAALNERINQKRRTLPSLQSGAATSVPAVTPLTTPRATIPRPLPSHGRIAAKRTFRGVEHQPHSAKIHKTITQTPSRAVKISELSPSKSRPNTSPKVKISPNGYKLRGEEEATIPFARRQGVTLMLTPRESARAHSDLVPVPRSVAQPPLTGLLYRYWHEQLSNGLNSANGFVAGRWMRSNVAGPPPPQCETFNTWSDMLDHLDCNKTPSPYISTSNSLSWIMRQALQQCDRTRSNVNITVINAAALDTKAVFHARPYQKELLKSFGYTNGAHHYTAIHEFLVWNEILPEAILGTFTVQNLLDLEAEIPSVAVALRLRELAQPNRGYRTKILPAWVAEKVGLTPSIINTMAKLCKLVTLDPNSISHVAHVVSSYIVGWGIAKEPLSADQWLLQASQFAEAFCKANGTFPNLAIMTTLKTGYLFGIQLSCGDTNPLFKPETAKLMRKRSKVLGLHDPTGMIAAEVHASLSQVFVYDNAQRGLLGIEPNHLEVRSIFQQFRADVDFRGRPRAQIKVSKMKEKQRKRTTTSRLDKMLVYDQQNNEVEEEDDGDDGDDDDEDEDAIMYESALRRDADDGERE